jgi:sugar/nucleoside kinase (ribokinase family)
MAASSVIRRAKAGAAAIGTGFLPLDLVYRDDEPSKLNAFAGGTCGNVLSILGFLGWTGYPIARHNHSGIADLIRHDLAHWNVQGDFLNQDPVAYPPVVVQRVFSRPRGTKTHSFSWNCPGCGAYLPTFKPVLAKSVQELSPRLPRASVFFFDRVSRAALDLAKVLAEKGTVLVFEPSMIGDPKLFAEAYAISHIVKYSQERIADVREVTGAKCPSLEIETLGSAGLRFRRAGSKWKELEPFQPRKVVDTSGAGDWCSAGVIHTLCQDGAEGFLKTKLADVQAALRLGQAMGAWACGFEGARSGMYGVTLDSWRRQILRILKHGSVAEEIETAATCSKVTVEICCPPAEQAESPSAAKQSHSASNRICDTLLRGRQHGQTIQGRA